MKNWISSSSSLSPTYGNNFLALSLNISLTKDALCLSLTIHLTILFFLSTITSTVSPKNNPSPYFTLSGNLSPSSTL